MADERRSPPYNQPSAVPAKYNRPTLLKKDGDDLFEVTFPIFLAAKQLDNICDSE